MERLFATGWVEARHSCETHAKRPQQPRASDQGHLVQVASTVCNRSIDTGLARRVPLRPHGPGIPNLCDELLEWRPA
jgi:hypothetical protein